MNSEMEKKLFNHVRNYERFRRELDLLRLPLEQIPISQHKSHLSAWINEILFSPTIRLTVKLTTFMQKSVEKMSNPYDPEKEIIEWCKVLLPPKDVNLIVESYTLLLFVLHLRFLYEKYPVSEFDIKFIAHEVSESFLEALEKKLQEKYYQYDIMIVAVAGEGCTNVTNRHRPLEGSSNEALIQGKGKLKKSKKEVIGYKRSIISRSGGTERKREKVLINQGNKKRLASSANSIPNFRKRVRERKRQGQNKIHVGTIYGPGEQTELSPDHPENRLKTKGNQSGLEEEEINSTDPTIRSKEAEPILGYRPPSCKHLMCHP
ncbi:hypothetical protein TNIN_13451 [Trichonephila inaurata madagascariensis]|uniref:Uncharacterized protein n=1 Tax=Trichonephila inaurata madagascariensis TaxID=2747483 RepID=A0A8X7CJS6_9ARAC|nr:hypothetical protein TNIN_13451 [Trichonephila inaurata madagascariensis]